MCVRNRTLLPLAGSLFIIKNNYMTKTLLIDKQAFIDWYFDHDICKEFFNRHDILESLTDKGVFTITLQHILDSVGYLPADIVAEGQEPMLDDNDEIDIEDLSPENCDKIKNYYDSKYFSITFEKFFKHDFLKFK